MTKKEESRKQEPLRVLVAGGGVAALETALALRALAGERVSIELVAPERDFTHRPLAVAAPFRVGEVETFPLHKLAAAAGAELRQGAVTSVDPGRHVVLTDDGRELAYDVLVLALGARPVEAFPNALTFRGPQDEPALAALLEDIVNGEVRSVAFAVPTGTSWPLPLYELALLTGAYLTDRGTVGIPITLVTPEEAPLALFGPAASDAIRELFDLRGIDIRPHTTPLSFEQGLLRVAPGEDIAVERLVALPRLEGPRIHGLTHDKDGFVPTDEFGHVISQQDVYAVGDMTNFPLKQGGVATQQADAVAESIAADAGASLEPTPFKPVLRGLLLTGMAPRYLRAEPGSTRSEVDAETLWWPPAKTVGRYVGPLLAGHLGASEKPPARVAAGVPIELELNSQDHKVWSRI
jgi:sulfide:quinone oxidoreductase